MKKRVSRLFGTCFVLLGLLFVCQFLDLLTMPVHVGINIDFLGLQVKNYVPEGDIISYAMAFLGLGIVSFIAGGLLFKSGLTSRK